MTDPRDFKHELIELPRHTDAQEVVYALRIRGIEAEVRASSAIARGRAFSVMVLEWNLEQAKSVLPLILDAMLPLRADNGRGGCYFCGYSLVGTANHHNNCPECGHDLRSLKSRLAARGADGSPH